VMLQLNHRTAPDLPAVWAISASMSLPFIYQEVIWRAEWGLFDGDDIIRATPWWMAASPPICPSICYFRRSRS
jgi:hypothetical protein